MVDFLAATKKMDKHQAYQLTSLAGDVAITQLVDGTMGVHVKMPKSDLQGSIVQGFNGFKGSSVQVLGFTGSCCCGVLVDSPPEPPVEPTSKPADSQHAGITTPHGDHSPHHGGMVLMNGEMHYEVVFDRGGKHRVWFSDAVREDLPASIASNVAMVVTPTDGRRRNAGADDRRQRRELGRRRPARSPERRRW